MTDYARTEQQRFPYSNFNSQVQVSQNWEGTTNMPGEMQNFDSTVTSTPASQQTLVNNWVTMNGSPSYAAQGNTYQANGQNGNYLKL